MRSISLATMAGILVLGVVSSPVRAADDKKEGSQLLVAFGASVGALLFETHDKIDTCALAAGKDGANINQIETKLAITSRILKILIDNLAKAREDKLLSDADRTFVARATEAAKLVQEEANALRAYLQSKDDKDKAKYQEVRQKAEREIQVILGIKK